MARVTRKEWYRRVNASWPADVPPLTADEATRAARRLYRFVTKRTWHGDVVVTSGNRYTKIRAGRIVVNPTHGWHGLVHLLSHYLEAHAGASGHGAAHARLEMRMIREVVRRGWLEGKLRPRARAAEPAPEPTIDEARTAARAEKLARTLAAIERWERKERRAVNALRKLKRRRVALERAANLCIRS